MFTPPTLRGTDFARLTVVLVTVGALMVAAATATADPRLGPLPAPNPALGPVGTASQHGDSAASDATPLAGPGGRHGDNTVTATFKPLGGNCTNLLIGADGMPQAMCSKTGTLAPVVHLLDPATGDSLASLELPRGGMFSGVYGYLDNADRVVAIDGERNLVRVAHDRRDGAWRLFIAEATPIGPAVDAHCGAPGCDTVVAPMADYSGKVWFATQRGTVGLVDTGSGRAHSVALGSGEVVTNSISTSPDGLAVATTHALYLVRAGADGTPTIAWRKDYDRGPGRKPGQLSWGTGSTPTFFGPGTGSEYVAIVDNAAPKENLLVFHAGTGEQVCSIPVVDGTENSPIGVGDTVFVASTYGYPYPPQATPGPSVPSQADFVGGIVRVDVKRNGTCQQRWAADVRSAAVPKISLADGHLYTVSRVPGQGGAPDRFDYTVINGQNGKVESTQTLGAGPQFNTLQLPGNIGPNGVLYQGTVAGYLRIAATGR
ncbi:hypothetical protein ACFWU5_07880 [Nocardia sp. NPDC058640]|uniref:hypothetical protein n=1 Tax=Nocardia sp. NPDC058640 TaxID=3346571 RepID=UPI0036495832